MRVRSLWTTEGLFPICSPYLTQIDSEVRFPKTSVNGLFSPHYCEIRSKTPNPVEKNVSSQLICCLHCWTRRQPFAKKIVARANGCSKGGNSYKFRVRLSHQLASHRDCGFENPGSPSLKFRKRRDRKAGWLQKIVPWHPALVRDRWVPMAYSNVPGLEWFPERTRAPHQLDCASLPIFRPPSNIPLESMARAPLTERPCGVRRFRVLYSWLINKLAGESPS